MEPRRCSTRSGKVIGVAGFSREVNELNTQPESVERFAKVIEHVHTQFGEPLQTSDLAKMAHLSSSQFVRRFQKAFGASPKQYLLRIRVDAAAKLLAETERTVTTIAQ